MQTANQNTGIKKVYGKITVDKVGPSPNSKKHTAQVRQIVTSVYAGVRATNSLNDGLFAPEEFGAEAQSYDEARVAFISVPVGTTEKEVQERLNKLQNARLVRILSLKPILSDEQQRGMEIGLSKNADGTLKTIEDYKEAQAVRDANGNKILYKGHEQYRVIAFNDGLEGAAGDVDAREQDLLDLAPVHMGAATVKSEKF